MKRKLAGTHAGGFVLTRQAPAGKWAAATYALTEAELASPTEHRTHRMDRPAATPLNTPVSPMGPMPDALRPVGFTRTMAFRGIAAGLRCLRRLANYAPDPAAL